MAFLTPCILTPPERYFNPDRPAEWLTEWEHGREFYGELGRQSTEREMQVLGQATGGTWSLALSNRLFTDTWPDRGWRVTATAEGRSRTFEVIEAQRGFALVLLMREV